jgi:hypothetical protein
MIIENAPLMSFEPRFVSSPSLSQMEIYSLLGHHPQGGNEGDLRNIATSVIIDSLAQFTVVQHFQRQVRDYLGLDMLSMRTQLVQNMAFQATRNWFGDGSIDSSNQVGNYFDNTTIFAGKYFGGNIFGEAMLSFKHDENRMSWGGLVIEPEISLEMRNPLFDIRINMIPFHSENWFIDDISFSLLWRRTF